jgi:putative phosphoribosyl transferase
VVLALPRGGVPVGAEVAARLAAPLRVIMVRKIGAPGRPELAMGALALVGRDASLFRNEEIIHALSVSEAEFESARARELVELRRRAEVFAGGEPVPLAGAEVIIVDDGLATGSTMLAAVTAVRSEQPARLIAAAPVGSSRAVEALRSVADEVVCPLVPHRFIAVGLAYADFHQLSDADVRAVLSPES